MKICTESNKIGFWSEAFAPEGFEVLSVKAEIIEEYGSLGKFIHDVFLCWVPDNMRMPKSIYEIFFVEKLNNFGKDIIGVRYNSREINIQMLIDFFKKIGIEVSLYRKESSMQLHGYDVYKIRKRREDLFGVPENLSDNNPKGRVSISYLQIMSEKFKNHETIGLLEGQFEEDMGSIEYSRMGIIMRFWVGGWQHYVIAVEYYDDIGKEDVFIEYLRGRFGLETKGELD
ncbi:MAG: hypothetical protein WC120_02470 [Parcubacteria group bacterium]